MPRPPSRLPADLITLTEAAEIARVHPRTIRRWFSNGHLTGYRFGPRLIRIDPSELTPHIPTASATPRARDTS
jgi:excisionase family DNA binding protein